MESLSDTKWDVVISGTGLQQSILALALSRSGKNILHVDPNDYYGGCDAAFSLQDVEEWVNKHQTEQGRLFGAAEIRKQSEGLSFSRAYSLALAPSLIHSRSKLLSQLVDSKAFRQIEFLAVGSFYIYQPSSDSSAPSLSRIPSTREDVFSNTSIPVRSKRSLMKFLKFVLDYESEAQRQIWEPHADKPMPEFLASEFKLDNQLQSYVITLTLSIDGKISVKDGLHAISRHLSSMGVFGPGFAAVYPKWGGLSEVAQVGCRAAAVGGAVYMLGTGIQDVSQAKDEQGEAQVRIALANETKIQSKLLVQGSENMAAEGDRISRLTAIVKSDLKHIFEGVVEGSPTPAVVVVAFPCGSIAAPEETTTTSPIYAMVHSSETGECPRGQCAIYLSTVCNPDAVAQLEKALSSLLAAVDNTEAAPECLYQLYYEQGTSAATSVNVDGTIITLPLPSLDLAFNDSTLDPVHEAWKLVVADAAGDDGVEYMKFEDREGANDYDDAYDYE